MGAHLPAAVRSPVITSMSSYLRQQEVDALSGVTVPAPEVRPYDFLAPPRLPREHRVVLEAALARLTPAVATLLSTRLRRPVDVVAGEPETATLGDFVNALPSPCACVPFGAEDNRAVVELSLPFCLFFVERLFGGAGEGQWLERALTPLEQSAIVGVAERVPALVADALRLPALAGKAGALESDPSSLTLGSRDQALLVVRLQIRAPGLECQWTLGLPLAQLEPLFAAAREDAATPAPQSADNARELHQAHVTVVARLPLFRLRARDLVELSAGQTLATGHTADIAAEVLVNGCVRFRATVGQLRGQIGLRITETVATPLPARPARDREGRAQ